jgi:hypothetical protein
MRQKNLPIPGIRPPAADMQELPKGDKPLCLRIDSDLHRELYELSSHWCMKVATYAKRVLYDHVAAQRLLVHHCNQRNQRRTA